ncbi:MAG TPA: hypothetical protein VJQ59_18860 [Candidatus Sulfotelmatobacter sp.]|nr:hypothetical protein [Candidatus Sulfotelmatobacter sp.]
MKKVAVALVFVYLQFAVLSAAVSAQNGSTAPPSKIDVTPVNLQNELGADLPLHVQLLDANGRPAAAHRNFTAEVKVQQPSGQTNTFSVNFAQGESAKQISIPANEAGVAKLTVAQTDQELIGGSNFVLVRPPKEKEEIKAPGKPKQAAKKKNPAKGSGAWLYDFPVQRRARLIFAAYAPPQAPVPAGSTPAGTPAATTAGQLMLTVSGEDANGGTRADGTTCARVQIFYVAPVDLDRDIEIWLSPSNGNLDNNPIVIHRGAAVGAACWTSQYPIAAATLTAADPPGYTFTERPGGGDPHQVVHKFTDNITGIEFANAPKSITIVDSFGLIARFVGPNGPVRLSDQREVHFSADSAVLNLKPLQTVVQPGGFDSSTILIPNYFGSSTVQVFTPGYPPFKSEITITFFGVLCASLFGGFLGGLASWISSAGKLWVRIVTGLIVGLVGSWAYVIVGLPKVETPFLHNQLSVLFVALLVGFSGVKGLTFIASKFGLPSF